MHMLRSILSATAIGAAAVTALSAASSTASAADIDVHVYRPRPAYAAPAADVYVARARVVTVGPNCVTRRTRVWVGDRYAHRTVRRCY